MHALATLIVSSANVEAARAAADAIPGGTGMFQRSLDRDGVQAGYVSSGHVDHDLIDAVTPHCEVVETAPGHDPHAVIAAAGYVFTPPIVW